MPTFGFRGKRREKLNGPGTAGFVISFQGPSATGWRRIVFSLEGAERLGSPR